MPDDASGLWLRWARKLQAISQNGLAYSTDRYDRERFAQIAAVAAEIVAAHTQHSLPELRQQFSEQAGYATPKVDVRGALVVEQRILLVQERSDRGWCLPGGWAEVGESPSTAVIREVQEECGLTIRPYKVVGIYDADSDPQPRAFMHAYKMVFLCEPIAGTLQASAETLAADYFAFDALPSLSARRTDLRHFADIQAHVADPQAASMFD